MSYNSFYRPTESRRLSQPSWQALHRDGLGAVFMALLRQEFGRFVSWMLFQQHQLAGDLWTKPVSFMLNGLLCA